MTRSTAFLWLGFLVTSWLLPGCVDPLDLSMPGRVNVVVVDASITNQDEPQLIRLSRSKADPFTGRFGTLPLTKATVDVIVDAGQTVRFVETDSGRYQAPASFIGQVGHRYQLRFVLSDGTRYESSVEIMPDVPPITTVHERFNDNSLSPGILEGKKYKAANELSIDWRDPANQINYYRWDWVLWEKQQWCRTCRGSYIVYALDPVTRQYTNQLFEDCYYPDKNYSPPPLDYECRTECWEKLYNYSLDVFSDANTNGQTVSNRLVAQIPYYQERPCLVEIRQSGLTSTAYAYFKLLEEQTQNAGGLADTPPAAPAGNIHNVANKGELVVGYFTASAIARKRYWINRANNPGRAAGLFEALNGRGATPEPSGLVPYYLPKNAPSRPPTAVCVPSDSRTPFKPDGWQN